jgi:hypothetical protein
VICVEALTRRTCSLMPVDPFVRPLSCG